MRTPLSVPASLLIVVPLFLAAVPVASGEATAAPPAAGAGVPAPEALAPRHFELARSLPAADSEAPQPTAVVLWFTQRPQDGATTIRVLDASGAPVPVADLVQDPVDPKVFLLPVPEGLAPGSYTVSWRSMAADGHPVRGEFPFTAVAP